jgi:putative hemolysin
VIWISVVVVFLLVLIEAVFAASEMALVSLREGQISALAERGKRGQRLAVLVSNPNRFLSAVQIGVTTTALLSSAFGAVTLSHSAARGLRHLGMAERGSEVVGFLIVTLAIAYVTDR